ncbi:hypothetical protein KHS38_05730 [Mucilaginibacter sp. Bleaf8]|uniref:hypothetical protein n=1 Tax=Mucilaginibacter sp. Bleaf8 TaxID=2834430 RepID=UPI001BD02556|nr:hypothetical protein [Mucilaginibacter sp. Bleaf8]MBS7563898.1 hypothetical protein [Mucilaginibacter sp. Bleaf8]
MHKNKVQFAKPGIKKRIKPKVLAWLKRFLPAELVGSALAILVSYVTLQVTHNAVMAAYAAAIADTTGFYITLFIQGLVKSHRELKSQHQPFKLIHILQVFKTLLVEFGPAEILDSFLLRPFFMYIFPVLLHNRTLGVLAGKIVSDISFYIPVIIIAELKGKFRERTSQNK